MKNKNKILLTLIVFSAFLRFVYLGSVPAGLSSVEAKFGIILSNMLGQGVINVFFLRLPFAILGVLNVFLLYKLIFLYSNNFRLAMLSAVIFSVSPWHLQESRIFSWGILITTAVLLLLLVLRKYLISNHKKSAKTIFIFSTLLFLISFSRIPPDAAGVVNYERNIAAKSAPLKVAKVFSNKLVESARHKTGLFFEHLDFGNYFFSGYPRQRWGVEEVQKLYIVTLPFLIYGIFKLNKKYLLSITLIFAAYVFLLSALNLRTPTWGLPLLLFFAPLTALGAKNIIYSKRHTLISLVFFFIFIFEGNYYWKTYKLGISESEFSPRQTIYKDLSKTLSDEFKPDENAVISSRLNNPEVYINYYRPELADNLIIKSVDYGKDLSSGKIFVDILPDDPSPSEPLFKKDGKWPEYLDVISEIPDKKSRQTVVVFRSKL